MKTKLYLVVLSISFMLMTHQSFSQANTSLSNLTSATAINHSLVAGANNSLSLGSGTIGWRNLYLTNGFYINNTLVFSTPLKSNIAIGARALYLNTTTDHLIAIGDSAFYHNSTGARGTAVGSFALYNNTTGDNNTAFGYQSLYYNSIGNSNIAAGLQALYANTTGSNNIASGAKALYTNTTGYSNVAIGIKALYTNTNRSNQVAVGDSTLYNNGTGATESYHASFNTAVGSKALYANTTGYYNTANGYQALYSNTTGPDNTAIGSQALYANTTGSNNTANGFWALYSNTIGYANAAYGFGALYANTTGYDNTAVGNSTLAYNTASYNTAVGYGALGETLASEYNTAIGYYAGETWDNGYNNVFVGANTDVNGAGYYNVIAIGQGAVCTSSSQVTMGNSATSSYRAYANWSNISDERVKKNIKQNVPGLAFINKLQPITYNLDLNAADKIIQYQRKDSTGKIIPLTQVETDARKAKQQIVYTGFIAQDVEKAAKSLNYDFSGVDAAKNSKDLYALRYAEFVVPLVKAVQELSKMNDIKDAKIDSLKNQFIQQQQINTDLEARLSKIEAMLNVSSQSTSISTASLAQNIPNPFTNSTIINYNLPQSYSSARIILTDKKGVVLKEITLNTKGNGSLNVDASTLASGAYQYSLYVNGRLIDTKQMVSSK